MASNSIIQCGSSPRDLIRRYDVFVSFRGTDTRKNFTSHLFGALCRNGINFFRDDTKLDKGEEILPELLQAIDESQILVVVFSKNYASSKWCLRELEKIASFIDVQGRYVIPIFYDVTPSDVRKQGGDYKEAFDKYEKEFKEEKEKMEEVQRWRQALFQVANLSGWDIGDNFQYEEIEKIVPDIQRRLPIVSFPSLRNDDLVGIESRVEKLEIFLLLDSVDVMSLGICGMAGMGKTTLVSALCKRIHHYFEFNYFVHDVSKICKNLNIQRLQKYLLGQDLHLESCYNVSSQTNLVSNGRRLIVLDNVGHIEQLEELNLDHIHGGPGSRIIIISEDERILEEYGVDDVYRVKRLNEDNALQLFCKYAFEGNCVMSEYEKLTTDVLSYAEGHPLLIKVLGRHLADLDVLKWNNALAKLRKNPKKNILEKLRISFDDLEKDEKELFLDIACFYEWYQKISLMKVLQFRGFDDPKSGLETLRKKSLIDYYGDSVVSMPTLLMDLGKSIVKESLNESKHWRRLWDYQDLLKVLLDKAPTNLEVIIVGEYVKLPMKVDALSNMNQLKLLILQGMRFSGSLKDLSSELGYLMWNQYPFEYLPSNFQPNNLVKLVMEDSSIKLLWKEKKALPNLECLDLSYSRDLVEMPNFEDAPNLERLEFGGCIKLTKIHSSISVLRKLTFLNLKECESLVEMPDFGEALNLEVLSFQGCKQLIKMHPSIGSLKKLRELSLKDCKNLLSLPPSLLDLSSLEYLNLSGCLNLYNRQLLEVARDAKHFKKPRKGEAPIHSQSTSSIKEKKSIHSESTSSIKEKSIHSQSASSIKEKKSIHSIHSQSTSSTKEKKSIHSQSRSSMKEKSFICSASSLLSSRSFSCMCYLDLSFCNLRQIPDAVGNLCCLQSLNLRGNKFEKMPSLKKLSKLVYINLERCKQLEYLFELPSQTDFLSVEFQDWFEMETIDQPRPRESGLIMFNCPKFVESEEWSRRNIAWMIQLVKANDHEWGSPFCSIGSVIPGNEIPRWFNNHHMGMGNSISVDGIHLRQDNDNWVGVAFCGVFSVSYHGKHSVLKETPRIFLFVPIQSDVHLATDKSDHMYLFYLSRYLLEQYLIHGGILEVEFRGDFGWGFEVKKYGYRLVHEQVQDLQLSNMASKHCEIHQIESASF